MGVCEPTTGICSKPEIACDDHDSCFKWAGCGFCLPDNCSGGGGLPAPLCPGQNIPSRITNKADKAQALITRAAQKPVKMRKNGTKYFTTGAVTALTTAAQDLMQAVNGARKDGNKGRISSDCASSLQAHYGEARSRVKHLLGNPQ